MNLLLVSPPKKHATLMIRQFSMSVVYVNVVIYKLKIWISICDMIASSSTHRSSRLFHLVAGTVWFIQLRICKKCDNYYHYRTAKYKPQRLHFERPPPPSIELLCHTMTKLLACIFGDKALAVRVFNLDYCSSFKYGVQVCYIYFLYEVFIF